MNREAVFVDVLKQNRLRVTKERLEVFRLLGRVDSPLTRSELLGNLKHFGMHPPTLYRTIELFVSVGIIQSLSSISGEVVYELLPPFAPHHHHYRCMNCGLTFPLEVSDDAPEEVALRSLTLPGAVVYHQVDIFGTCFKCLRERNLAEGEVSSAS